MLISMNKGLSLCYCWYHVPLTAQSNLSVKLSSAVTLAAMKQISQFSFVDIRRFIWLMSEMKIKSGYE